MKKQAKKRSNEKIISFMKTRSLVVVAVLIITGFVFGYGKMPRVPNEKDCNDNTISFKDNFYLVDGISAVVNPLGKTVNDKNFKGALGRNATGYVHVRFQSDVLSLAIYSVLYRDVKALDAYEKALKYSFARQKSNGDFTSGVDATEKTIVSGDAFFLSYLANSLFVLKDSDWSVAQDIYKKEMYAFKPRIKLALDYLKTKKQLLEDYDSSTVNRLFFDANAFFTTGLLLGDEEAKNTGAPFSNNAIQKQASTGYFLENGGYDSSYNSVSLVQGYFLLDKFSKAKIDSGSLEAALIKGTCWQATRIMASGEISTEGNSRVYPGGETYFDKDKVVDPRDSYSAFLFANSLTSDRRFLDLSNKIRVRYNGVLSRIDEFSNSPFSRLIASISQALAAIVEALKNLAGQ